MTNPTDPSKKNATGQSAQGITIPGVRNVVPGRVSQPTGGSGESPSNQTVPPTLGDSPLQPRNSQVHPAGPALDLAQLAEEIQALRSENNRLQILSAKHADEICSLKCQWQDSTAGGEGVNVSTGVLRDLLDQAASIISTSAGQPSPSKTVRFMADDISRSPISSYIHDIIKLSYQQRKICSLS
jgi:hypothetical protein